MKKSSLVIISVLVALIAVSIIVFKKKGKASTLNEEGRDFKYKDTASITKIFLADKNGRQCTVVRTKNGWVVNDKYPARPDAILTLLETIRNVEVQRPVSKQAKEGVLKILAARAIKVEIYANDELVKQYYVGHETPDGEGTHMLLTDIESGDNYEDPYITFIPGFTGFLNTRYIVEEKHWRSLSVMNFTPDKLTSVNFQNYEKQDSTFTVNVFDTKTFTLQDNNKQVLPFSEMKMKQYLAYFQNVNCEALFTSSDKKLVDSLSKAKPFAAFNIKDKSNKLHSYYFYHKPPPAYKNADYGVNYKYDPDRLYVNFDDKKEWAVIQYFVFGKLFVTTEYFKTETAVKK